MKLTNLFTLLAVLLTLSQIAFAGGVTYYDCKNQDDSMSYRIYRCDKNQSEVRKFGVNLDELARLESRKSSVGVFSIQQTQQTFAPNVVALGSPSMGGGGSPNKVQLGMTQGQVRAILGTPKEVHNSDNTSTTGVTHNELWTYQKDDASPPQFVHFKSGLVTETNFNSVTGRQPNSTFGYEIK